ncbi:hypothetical protein Gpo141_00008128 [Globisporangium polare]
MKHRECILPPPRSQPERHLRHRYAMHRHQSLTAVSLLCAACAGLDELAPTINSFIDPPIRKRWTIERACELNNLTALRHLIAREAPDAVHPLYRSHVFSLALVHAVRHDNVEMLECLCAFCPSGYASKGMAEAAALGKVHLMEWVIAHCAKVKSLTLYTENAAHGGHLNVLQWLKKQSQSATAATYHLRCALQHAARSGHLAVVQWLHENTEPLASPATHQAVQSAIEGGHLDVLEYLLAHGYEHRSMSFKSPLGFAVEAGNLEMVKWVVDNKVGNVSAYELQIAIENGRSDIAKWLLRKTILRLDRSENAFVNAAGHCDIEVVQLVHGLHPPSRYSDALRLAAGSGRLDVVEWLYRTAQSPSSSRDSPRLAEDRRRGYGYDAALSKAAANGHLSVVQWLFHNLRVHHEGSKMAEVYALGDAAGNGHVDVVEWLHSQIVAHETRCPTYDIFEAAVNGHLELVQWIAANADIHVHTDTVAYVAANGHLKMLKWLDSEFADSLEWNSASAMTDAAVNGHLTVVKWLHANHNGGVTKQAMDAAASLEMVQWLHEHYGESVGCTTRAMDNAAKHGDFETLQFLHANRSEGCSRNAAPYAHENGHVLVFEWLCETYPDVVNFNVLGEYLTPTSVFKPPLVDRRTGTERQYLN